MTVICVRETLSVCSGSYLKNRDGFATYGAKGTVIAAYSTSQNHCRSTCKGAS